jgi:hypothetical protein
MRIYGFGFAGHFGAENSNMTVLPMSYAQSHGHLLTIRRTNAHASAPDVVAAVRACFVARCVLRAHASAPDVVSAPTPLRRPPSLQPVAPPVFFCSCAGGTQPL